MSAGASDARSAISTSARLTLIVPLALERQCLAAPADHQPATVSAAQSGPGAANAARAAHDAVQQGATALMSIGVAGGIADEISVGDVVIADSVIDESGDQFQCSAQWVQQLQRQFADLKDVRTGRLLSVSSVLETEAEKRAAAQRHHAIACDMESAAVAAVADAASVHFVALRIISDAVSDKLPQGVEGWVDAAGNARIQPALISLLSPARWRTLFATTARFRVAQRRLRELSRTLTPVAYCCPR